MKKNVIIGLFISIFSLLISCGPGPGTLRISTLPNNATIYLDGELIGKSPQMIKGLEPGMHKVELQLQDYQNTEYNIEVISNQITEYKLSVLTGTIEDDIIKASRENNLEVVQSIIILMQGNGVENYTVEITSALQVALSNGNIEIASELINLLDDDKKSELLIKRFREALEESGYEEICSLLKQKGVDVDYLYNGQNLLADYITKGDQKRVDFLLSLGANANIVFPDGKTPVYYALMQSDLDVLASVLRATLSRSSGSDENKAASGIDNIDAKYKWDIITRINWYVNSFTVRTREKFGSTNFDAELELFSEILSVFERSKYHIEYDKNIFRNAYYWIATQYFSTKDFLTSADYYILAIRYAISNTTMENDVDKLLESVSVGQWLLEAVDSGPSYYIAYNLACAYSRVDKYSLAFKWLRLAVRINYPHLLQYLISDPDIELLRDQKDRFVALIREEVDPGFSLD